MTTATLTLDAARAIATRVVPGQHITHVRALTGGVSATIHAIHLTGHPPLVVRQHAHASGEFALMSALGRQGIPVPAVRLLDTSGTVLDAPYLVMDLVAGTPLVDLAGSIEPVLGQMARVLAALHRIDIGLLDDPALPAVDAEVAHLMSSTIDDMQAGRIRAALRSAGERDRAASCLLHGDYWPGNILVDDARMTAILDWEDAAIGSPLWDVANARLEVLWSHGPAAMTAFTVAYAEATGTTAATLVGDLAPWDLRIALRPIGKIETWGLPASRVATMRALHRQFVDRAIARLANANGNSGHRHSPTGESEWTA